MRVIQYLLDETDPVTMRTSCFRSEGTWRPKAWVAAPFLALQLSNSVFGVLGYHVKLQGLGRNNQAPGGDASFAAASYPCSAPCSWKFEPVPLPPFQQPRAQTVSAAPLKGGHEWHLRRCLGLTCGTPVKKDGHLCSVW